MLKELGFLGPGKEIPGGFTPCIEGRPMHGADQCLALLRTEHIEVVMQCSRGECVIM